MTKFHTADGSFTLFDETFGEHYHSLGCGALRETMQKHIIPAFEAVADGAEELNILDICFGLGFNTLASVAYAKAKYPELRLNILSPELNEKVVRALKNFSYPAQIADCDIEATLFDLLSYEDGRYKIDIVIGDARDVIRGSDTEFDIVYQDPFSPPKNPSLWSVEYFGEISARLSKRAVITTYSIASGVRAAMFTNGLNIYEHYGEDVRKSTVASNFEICGLKKIDMCAKMQNLTAKIVRDKDLNAKE